MEKLPGEDAINEELLNFKDNEAVSHDAVCKMLDERGTRPKNTAKSAAAPKPRDPEYDPLADDDVEIVSVGPRGRSRAMAPKEEKSATATRGRGRGAKATRGGAAPRVAAAAPAINPRTKRAAMPQLDVSVGSTVNVKTRITIANY